MFEKILHDPKKFWGALFLLFSFFLLVTAYGGRKIYEIERQSLRREAETKLHSAEEILRAEFADLREEHDFLWRQPAITHYLDSGFADQTRRAEIERFFYLTLQTHDDYRKIALVDKGGRELIGLHRDEDGQPEIAPTGVTKLREYQQSLADSESRLTGDRTCVLATALVDGHGNPSACEPGLLITTGLFDDRGEWRGLLSTSLSLKKVLALLPSGTILHTDGNPLFDRSLAGGKLPDHPSSLKLSGDHGVAPISDTQVVHYVRASFVPDQRLFITYTQNMVGLKTVLLRITAIFLAILSVFFVLLLVLHFLRANQFRELIEAQRTIVFSLANLAEWRDTDTGRHLERTRNFSVLLARQLRKNGKYAPIITGRFLSDLYDAAPLHDLGKVGIPDSILLKSDRLNPEEFRQMQGHVLMGRDILQGVIDKLARPESFLLMSRNIAEFHHEKYNGGGYPHGLAGEAIPLEGRLYALCDAYDAIRSLRPYKDPVSHLEAVERIYAGRGNHFDPEVVDAFLDCETEFMEIFEAHLLYDEVYSRLLQKRGGREVALAWSDALAVGVEIIDTQHKELISRINDLYRHIFHGRGKEEAVRLMHFLEDYVVEHFATEERYMLAHRYPDYAAHKEMHDCFIEDFKEIDRQIETEGISSDLVLLINRKVVNWLVNHIIMVDKGLSRIEGKDSPPVLDQTPAPQ